MLLEQDVSRDLQRSMRTQLYSVEKDLAAERQKHEIGGNLWAKEKQYLEAESRW